MYLIYILLEHVGGVEAEAFIPVVGTPLLNLVEGFTELFGDRMVGASALHCETYKAQVILSDIKPVQ